MKYSGQHRRIVSILAAAMLLLSTAALTAQPERRIVPRHDWAIELPELGRMTGLPEDGGFADKIYPVGDVDGDSLCDWVVTRSRRDTLPGGKSPSELLLYHGVRGGLPDVSDRIRIGPPSLDVNMRLMAVGDWDNNQAIDLATTLQPFYDTTFGPSNGKPGSYLVIWWGNETGTYSVNDTSHLLNGMDAWIEPDEGFSRDLDEDGIPELILSDVKGFLDGEPAWDALVQVWMGSDGKRWGRELPRRSTWSWWSPPAESYLNVFHRTQWIDQDVDGYLDFVWYNDSRLPGESGSLSIIYGTPEHVLDTANIHTIRFDSSSGKYALFRDITGDNVPELLLNTGGEESIKAYIGFRGQRVEEQYGLGNEPGHPGEGVWWGRPWATIPLPGQLHDGWAASGWSPIYEFPDAGLDGVGDVWVFSIPDFICYNGGQRFDSIYDSWITRPGTGSGPTVVLGDIDGSGLTTIALGFGYTGTTRPTEIAFFQPSKRVPETGTYRYMPPGVGTPQTGVEDEGRDRRTAGTFDLQARPNPSSGVVRLSWRPATGRATILITDQLGQTVTRFETEGSRGDAEWDAWQTFGAVYFVSIEIDGIRESTEVRIQR